MCDVGCERGPQTCNILHLNPPKGREEGLYDSAGVTVWYEDKTIPQIPPGTRIPPAYRPLHPDMDAIFRNLMVHRIQCLQVYNFTSKHAKADALSRGPCPRHELTNINVSDSRAAWGYLLSLLLPQMTGTMPQDEEGEAK
jgi:hypothetical protein